MAISTLNEYYSSKGQALPSVSERQGMAAQAGIQNYTGTAQQNTQLLSSLMSNQGNQTAVPNTTIPAPVAVGTTTPVNLPNRPTPQEPSNLYTQAAAIIASLPKTGVAGIDQANQALAQLPGQLYEQQGIGAKQTAANEAQTALKLFEEETRQKLERERTNAQLGAETLASRSYAIEKDRAFMAGTLAIKAAAANQDFETAMSVMKTMSDMITEPLRQTRDFFKEMYMKTEDQKFQRAMRAEDRAYQAAREDAKILNDAKAELMRSGAPIDQILDIKTMDDYYKFAGQNSIIKPKGSSEQFKAASFANRTEQAESVFSNVVPKISSMDYTKFKLLALAPNFLQSPEMQKFSQASKNFINAVLRRESGAAISKDEFDNALAQYIPAPGDTQEVISQKEQNRLLIQRNLINEAGSAYVPLTSDLMETQAQQPISGQTLFNNIKKQVSSIYDPSKGFIIPGKTQ